MFNSYGCVFTLDLASRWRNLASTVCQPTRLRHSQTTLLVRRTESPSSTAFLETTASGFLNAREPPALMAKADPDPAVLPSNVTALLKLENVVQSSSFVGYIWQGACVITVFVMAIWLEISHVPSSRLAVCPNSSFYGGRYLPRFTIVSCSGVRANTIVFPKLRVVPIKRTTGILSCRYHVAGAGVDSLSFGCNSVLRGSACLSLRLRGFASVHMNAPTEESCSVLLEVHVFIEPNGTRKIRAAASRAEYCCRKTRKVLNVTQR